jgi:hypothetical protein
MIARASRKTGLRTVLLLVILGLVLVVCGPSTGESSLPEGCDGVTWGNSIQVEERPEGYVLLIGGDMPDSCSTVCGHEQTVEGSTINIDLFSSRPEDEVCAQMLTPFRVEVALDTEGLDPGEYTVTLNETHAETTFTMR